MSAHPTNPLPPNPLPPYNSNPPIIMINNPPAPILANIHLITHNRDPLRRGSHKVLQQRPNNRLHTRREHNHRDIVLATPRVERVESRVELDVLAQDVDAFVERGGGGDTFDHFTEFVAEGGAVLEDFGVAGETTLFAEADVVELGGVSGVVDGGGGRVTRWLLPVVG